LGSIARCPTDRSARPGVPRNRRAAFRRTRPDPNPVEPAMVEAVLRQAHGCRGRLRAPRSSRDGAAAFPAAPTQSESRQEVWMPHTKSCLFNRNSRSRTCSASIPYTPLRFARKPHHWQCVCASVTPRCWSADITSS
jgi:hypothetical protein